ncbi:MAG TPA: TonB family protein [Bryobacteraceae bacterium]|nr:TonB family protein [Bryobacteraceae bacterium]
MKSSDLDAGPNLLLDWKESTEPRRWLRDGLGSLAIHIVIFLAALGVGRLETPAPPNPTEVAIARKVTPLYAPRELTQKAPNRDKVSKEVNVERLMASAAQKSSPPQPPVRSFRPPQEPQKTAPEPPPVARIAEPPKIAAATNNPPVVPPVGVPKPPPPKIEAEEKPKLAFETPEQYTARSRPANSKVAAPGTSVDDAVRRVVQSKTVVEDIESPPNIPGTVGMPPSPAANQGRLELLSDPMGVDFRPYLIRILAVVRRNWFSVIPESARLGNRGITQLQFIIDRNGQVPKLVIANTSGSDSLDKAAVAGVSASVPFPPLPAEFRGREIRVQFAFKYNVK